MVSEADKIQKKISCEHQAECMKMVQLIVDGQASEEEIHQFKLSMDKCLPCETGYELEKCIKETLRLRLEKKCIPSNLIDCINQKVNRL